MRTAFLPKLQDGKIKVACVGDSITFGQPASRYKDSWPILLQDILGSEYQVLNYGISGATLLDSGEVELGSAPYPVKWINAIMNAKPQIIILMLGTNDSKPQNWNAVQFEKQYMEWIQRFKSLDNEPYIFCVTPLPANENRYNIDGRVIQNEIRPIVQKISSLENVYCIDLYTVMYSYMETLEDGVHPNAVGSKIIADTIADALAREGVRQ
jgi:lysophospholipase L1-like esterase